MTRFMCGDLEHKGKGLRRPQPLRPSVSCVFNGSVLMATLVVGNGFQNIVRSL